MEREQIVQILQEQITLYKHLGLTPVRIDEQEARFQVSLAANLNHKNTAFGGSIYATAVMTAYSLVLAILKNNNVATENIVIAKGEIKYFRPIAEDFETVCVLPKNMKASELISELQSHRKLRQELTVQVLAGGEICAELKGLFVVKES